MSVYIIGNKSTLKLRAVDAGWSRGRQHPQNFLEQSKTGVDEREGVDEKSNKK